MTNRLTTQQKAQLISTHPDISTEVHELIDGMVTISMRSTKTNRSKKMTFSIRNVGVIVIDSKLLKKVKGLEENVLDINSDVSE